MSFLIGHELQEMLNKILLYSKHDSNSYYQNELYADCRAALRSLIAIEKGKTENA